MNEPDQSLRTAGVMGGMFKSANTLGTLGDQVRDKSVTEKELEILSSELNDLYASTTHLFERLHPVLNESIKNLTGHKEESPIDQLPSIPQSIRLARFKVENMRVQVNDMIRDLVI